MGLPTGPSGGRNRRRRLVRQSIPCPRAARHARPSPGRDRLRETIFARNGCIKGCPVNAKVIDRTDGTAVARPSVSVLLPAWNEAVMLRRCLDSILAIDWPKLEVVLCAGGNDGTLEIANRYAADYPERIIL